VQNSVTTVQNSVTTVQKCVTTVQKSVTNGSERWKNNEIQNRPISLKQSSSNGEKLIENKTNMAVALHK
jgi:hypothetical protein